MPQIVAKILAGNAIATVTSHQWSSKRSTLKTFTRKIEVVTLIINNPCSTTDNFPNFVFGRLIIFDSFLSFEQLRQFYLMLFLSDFALR